MCGHRRRIVSISRNYWRLDEASRIPSVYETSVATERHCLGNAVSRLSLKVNSGGAPNYFRSSLLAEMTNPYVKLSYNQSIECHVTCLGGSHSKHQRSEKYRQFASAYGAAAAQQRSKCSIRRHSLQRSSMRFDASRMLPGRCEISVFDSIS